jgi:hypothetical protein
MTIKKRYLADSSTGYDKSVRTPGDEEVLSRMKRISILRVRKSQFERRRVNGENGSGV